jgi:Na+/H+ antiporter NhaC
MEKIKAFIKAAIAFLVANKKIAIPVAVAIVILIVGMVFGSKIKGCIDKPADVIITDEVK